MKDLLVIVGSIVSAVTCLIPLLNKDGDYSLLETVLNASGLTIGAGLVILASSLNSKYWPFLRTMSALLISLGGMFIYDNFIDLSDQVHTYHYIVIISLILIATLSICLYYKLRQR